jgi:hypothetical protein
MEETDDSGDGAKNPRRVERSERRGALDQGSLGLPHSREIKLCLGDSAGTLEQDGILGVAGDFAREFVQQFRQCRG